MIATVLTLSRRTQRTPIPLVVALMAESILIGIYAVIVGLVIWILKKNHRTMPMMHRVLFVSSIIMFFIATAHLGLLLQEAIVDYQGRAFVTAAVILAIFQFLIGDLILIWRVWAVWNRNYWIIALPLLVLAADIVFFSYVSVNTPGYLYYSTPVSTLILANTCICTLLIVFRVWYMRHTTMKLSDGRVTFSMTIFKGGILLLIESNGLFALSQIILLILYHVRPDAVTVMANLEMPLAGILPSLIIILVHFNRTSNTVKMESDHTTIAYQVGDRSVVDGSVSRTRQDVWELGSEAEGKNLETPDKTSWP